MPRLREGELHALGWVALTVAILLVVLGAVLPVLRGEATGIGLGGFWLIAIALVVGAVIAVVYSSAIKPGRGRD